MIKKIVRIAGAPFTIEIRDDVDQSVANEIFTLHEYRSAEPLIREAADPVADIGAHAGFFTLFARGLNPTVPISAIEPAAENVVQLKRHLSLNKIKGVEVVEGAVVGEKRRQKLVLTADSHNHYLSDTPNTDEETRSVPLLTLADIRAKLGAEQFSVVKCDIEGGEYDILLKTTDKELQKVKAFILEYHTSHDRRVKILETRLRELGYGVQVFPSKFDKTMGFIFAKNKRLKK
ncbi:MAG: FkbM family methyltransferase [Candidatus Magasanikbacteria bacterium]|nr:FkbM family methyltransferase [Candidatus Magasanikbacteria bacterium]